MQSSAKIAMKDRTKRWTSVASAFTPQEQLNNSEYLTHKVSYLEDMLRLYQQELDYHIKMKQTLKGVGALPMGVSDGDLNRMSESNVGMARQLRILNDEITALRKEKEQAVAQCTADFNKALQRNNERQAQLSRTLLQENEALKSRISSLEQEQRERKSMETAHHAVEIMDLKYRIDELQNQLVDTEKDVEVERNMRTALEEELIDARQELHDMVAFVEGFDLLAEDILHQIVKQRQHHAQLVNTLLQSSQSSQTGTASTDANSRSQKVVSNMHQTDSELQKLEVQQCGQNPTERLKAMLKHLESVSDSQQVELALAVRCAIDGFDEATKDLTHKLHSAYGHCELQVQRIEDLERQFSEQRDQAFSERDKAMNQRDQALLQLRSRQETRDHKFQKSVEVQTVVRGDFGTVFR